MVERSPSFRLGLASADTTRMIDCKYQGVGMLMVLSREELVLLCRHIAMMLALVVPSKGRVDRTY